MDRALYKIIIASSLHDMGKLLWRGGISRKNYKYKIAHAQYVFDFFNDKEKKYSNFWKEIWLLASLHHAADFFSYKQRASEEQKQLARVIYMADNISSGERIDEENLEEKKEYQNIKHFWLRPIFENVFTDTLSSSMGYVPMTLENLNFRVIEGDVGLNSIEDWFLKGFVKFHGNMSVANGFRDLAENFLNQLEKLVQEYNRDDFTDQELQILIKKLDILLQNYFTFVPSDAYKSLWDISLYDHTKTTLAIATVLWKNHAHLLDHYADQKTKDVRMQKVCLIAGDFPSIQKYLFGNIKKSTFLAKRLRAKSLTVQLLNEAVVEYLCHKLWVSRGNVLINAGGKFVIFTSSDKIWAIKEYRDSINSFLLENYDGNVKFCLVEKVLTLEELFPDETKQILQDALSELFEDLTKEKYHPYNTQLLKKAFSTKSVSWKVICNYCGLNYVDQEYEDGDACCELCKQDISLWANIVRASGGVFLTYHQWDQFSFAVSYDKGDEESLWVQWNSWDIEKYKGLILAKSINLYIPSKNDIPKSFTDLSSRHMNYLCMLKWDIDFMGLLLKHGFSYGVDKEHSIYSISRIVQLSRILELFFGKYIHQFIQREFPDVYTVFSWGDDFIFIVPFKDRFLFAKRLSEEFESFVAHNQKVHFSIWLSIFKEKTPFALVEKQAEQLLKSAKNFTKKIISSQLKNQKSSTSDLLKMRGFCIYDSKYVFTPKEVVDYWEELKLDRPRGVGGITSTMLYTLYIQIEEMIKILDEMLKLKKLKWAEYLHLWSRIFYMLKKNLSPENFHKVDSELRPILLSIGQESWEDYRNIDPINPIDQMKEKLIKQQIKILNCLYDRRELE